MSSEIRNGLVTAVPDYAEKLRQRRRELGLNQGDVAKRAGCAISLVSMAETGLVLTLERGDALAHALGASVGSFW